VERQQKRQQEKELEEQQKMDLQLLEAKRQQRKLNFLITQVPIG
jgi:DNA helicase INO80